LSRCSPMTQRFRCRRNRPGIAARCGRDLPPCRPARRSDTLATAAGQRQRSARVR
jgi:hypothetical protein